MNVPIPHISVSFRSVLKKTFWYHLLGWAVFIAYEVSFVAVISGIDSERPLVGSLVIPYFINIGLFYFHATVLLRIFFGAPPRNLLWIVLLLLWELPVYLLAMLFNGWLFAPTDSSFGSWVQEIDRLAFVRQLWRGIYFLIFSTSYCFLNRYFRNQEALRKSKIKALQQEQERIKIEMRLMSTQNAFLQSQINPHLLFNTLHFIYNLVRKASPQAAETIVVLSDLMRYSLDTKPDGKVLLEEEITQVHNLIRLHQSRFSHTLQFDVQVEPFSQDEHRIVPLLLIPFIENLFKYAELRDADHPAAISIKVVSGQLYFETRNKKTKRSMLHTSGIGIENVRKRLQSHYPDRFVLEIQDTDSVFIVKLQITL